MLTLHFALLQFIAVCGDSHSEQFSPRNVRLTYHVKVWLLQVNVSGEGNTMVHSLDI